MSKIIGTILHGALGDCYEQLCAIKLLRASSPENKWVGFFAVKERLVAMSHFKMDMLDEVYTADQIGNAGVDEYFQFQIKDVELNEGVLDHLPSEERNKFDFTTNILPWHILRSYDYSKNALKLDLSEAGKAYLPTCCRLNGISDTLFSDKFTVGFLWRYRSKGGAVNPLFQKSRESILQSKSELFNELIRNYNAHIIVAGMNKRQEASEEILNAKCTAGVVGGEHNSKFANDTLDIPDNCCTYLKGLGFAAEMEIMSHCDLLLMMPSGFSEPLWMRHSRKVLVMDPPPVYMAKIWRNKMPFFNNKQWDYAMFNTFIPHTTNNVIRFLKYKRLVSACT